MLADITVKSDTIVPSKPRQWSPTQARVMGLLNMIVSPVGVRFVVFAAEAEARGEKSNLHATLLLNSADELRRFDRLQVPLFDFVEHLESFRLSGAQLDSLWFHLAAGRIRSDAKIVSSRTTGLRGCSAV